MFGSLKTKAFWLFIALVAFLGAGNVSAQTTQPYLPDIKVQPTSTPLVKKTGGSTPVTPNPDIQNPLDSDINIPGYTGILVEDANGKIVKESYSDYTFNPASNVKVATSYAVLKTFGPEYRFPTNVYYDGIIDKTTATLNGNLYISGRDPMFNYEHGVAIADALNKLGVRSVTGDLVVTDRFIMNYSESTQRSGQSLLASLDGSKRSAAATRAWLDFLVSSGRGNQVTYPSVSVAGALYVDIIPNTAKLLFSHESAPLREIVKVTMCYSNNFLAERLGDMLGGAYAVARVVQLNANVAPQEFSLATSSGLGINRVTPKAQMKLLKALRAELARYKMTFADIMPIAGVDPGTLQNRFKDGFSLGSVVGKTGTLGNTDGGVSALCGEMQTRNGGKLLFVIFNQRGTPGRFRPFQDSYVTMIQNEFGGAAPLGYTTTSVALRLARTRITYANSGAASN
ncbi:MAG TPA: D-alanyl-D-alanine carboxypeptidase [Pyrinomonadaceae bacterium]|jgi:D-alanyl-D-alanine carboxypeptidase/D-alanyl-D-alanine-endopeptidase (penicillin-binding protein 4)